MKKLIKIDKSTADTLEIQYDVGNKCNYQCWYCFPDASTGTVPWSDVEVIKKNLVCLIDYYLKSKKVKKVKLVLLGGEPTIWPELGNLVEYIKFKTKCTIVIITNGSRTIRWWAKYATYFDYIRISVHHETVDLDHIKKLANLLLDKKVSFYTDVLMDHKHWNKCKSIVEDLCRSARRFMVSAKPIHIDGKTFYNNEQTEYLDNNCKRRPPLMQIFRNLYRQQSFYKITAYFDDGSKIKLTNDHWFKLKGLNKFKGWSCNLGVNFIFINREGNLTGTCNTKLYGLENYFNIKDPEFIQKFKPKIQPVVCDKELCSCSAEVSLPKKIDLIQIN